MKDIESKDDVWPKCRQIILPLHIVIGVQIGAQWVSMAAKVSVGIPVYNGERFLAATLESIVSQSHENLEIIVSDNASTDGTEETVRELACRDRRVQYDRHSASMGASVNYNFTLTAASSEYFMWNAHDDLRAPSFVASALSAFENHPHASCVFSRSQRIDGNGNRRHVMIRPEGAAVW